MVHPTAFLPIRQNIHTYPRLSNNLAQEKQLLIGNPNYTTVLDYA